MDVEYTVLKQFYKNNSVRTRIVATKPRGIGLIASILWKPDHPRGAYLQGFGEHQEMVRLGVLLDVAGFDVVVERGVHNKWTVLAWYCNQRSAGLQAAADMLNATNH